MTILPFVLAAMTLLAPGRDHTEIGTAISSVVDSERPLFEVDDDRRRTASLLVAIAFRESTFRNDVVSKTHDYCYLQINRRPDLATDPEACARVGLAMVRESFRMCRAFPIAFYAEGPSGCSSARAQRISRDRIALAQRLVLTVQP
jgi:hypothetical protein